MAMLHPNLGVMLQPAMGNKPLRGTAWAADNGCFSKGPAFDLTAFYHWLEAMTPWRSTCLFAVAPDVVGDAAATWERSAPVLPILREMGYCAALVAQDGLESLPVLWPAFDVLFIGGTTRWKLSEPAYALIAEARSQGKAIHAGRVNSLRRLRAMAMGGCSSADGTFLKYGPDKNLPLLLGWLDTLQRQPAMALWERAAESIQTAPRSAHTDGNGLRAVRLRRTEDAFAGIAGQKR